MYYVIIILCIHSIQTLSIFIGHEDGKSGREFIQYIAEAVSEKVGGIVANAHFMSVLTDGSQARKTGSDKEMVLTRTERNGMLCALSDYSFCMIRTFQLLLKTSISRFQIYQMRISYVLKASWVEQKPKINKREVVGIRMSWVDFLRKNNKRRGPLISESRLEDLRYSTILIFTYQHYILGMPVYFVASLLEMSDWGGTDAESLKNGIDGIFGENGSIPLTPADYHTKFIGCTSDGASVNFGRKTGLMTRFAEHRGWLIKIHCANHRIELAVKDAVKESDFTNVDEFYIGVHILLKTLGKLKGKSNQRQKL